MKRVFSAIVILPWLLIACTTVAFEEPQPSGNEVLKEIPFELLGHYFDYDNNRDLYITRDMIFTTADFKDPVSISELDKNERIAGDTLYHAITGQQYRINKVNDSLITGYKYLDILFSLNEKYTALKNVLKAEGNDYFLNYETGEHKWAVSRLAFRANVVNIANIQTENEVKMMETITNNKSYDTVRPLIVKPTKEQFEKFIKQNGFITGQTYLKTGDMQN
ncbi:MAG TPA: hypothetical protein PKE30_11770 [Niabella sp.]|nr:hypothetical protein [Niabella sp.]